MGHQGAEEFVRLVEVEINSKQIERVTDKDWR